MGADDKTNNKLQDLAGKAKEGIGGATGDENLERQGKNDQAKSDVKQAGEKIKDAFKH
jgi:uncharacterized protein YjbJ (UPF0337 family)